MNIGEHETVKLKEASLPDHYLYTECYFLRLVKHYFQSYRTFNSWLRSMSKDFTHSNLMPLDDHTTKQATIGHNFEHTPTHSCQPHPQTIKVNESKINEQQQKNPLGSPSWNFGMQLTQRNP